MRELVTKRLRLRRIRESDAERIFACWASDLEVTRYLTWKPHENVQITKQIVQGWLEEYRKGSCYRYGITFKGSDDLIGMINVVEYQDGNPLIGYVLGRAYWNHGYMSEAFSALIQELFDDGYSRILIEADERNLASIAVIRKNGFAFLKKETRPCSAFKPQRITVSWYYRNKMGE